MDDNLPLLDLLRRHDATDWDLLLVGDGSGNAWTKPSGYAVVVIDRLSRRRELLGGSFTQASIQMAELMPVLHGLAWHEAVLADLQRRAGIKTWNTYFFTDSAVVTNWLNQGGGPALSLAVEGFRQRGYSLQVRQIERDGWELHILVDHASRQARIGQPDLSLAGVLPGLSGLRLEDINP